MAHDLTGASAAGRRSPTAAEAHRRARRRWLVVAAAPLLGLLAAETFVRVQLRDRVDTARLRALRPATHLGPLNRPSDDPELLFELVPGFDDLHLGVRVVIDDVGLRVAPPEARRAPPADALRVAVVGASTTFGLGIAYEDGYVARLEPLLEKVLGRPVETRAFAVPAYNAVQQARLFERAVLPWRPDLVVWHYDHRDAYPALLPDAPTPMAPEYGDNLLHSALLKLVLRTAYEHRSARFRYDGSHHETFEGYFRSGAHYDRHLEALTEVARQAAAARIPVVFMIFDAFLRAAPDAAKAHLRALHNPLLEHVAPLDLHLFDLSPRYLEVMRKHGWDDLREWWRSAEPLDGHPNPAGHAFLAEEITGFVAGHRAELWPDGD